MEKETRLQQYQLCFSILFGIEKSLARRIICSQLSLYLVTKVQSRGTEKLAFLVLHKQTITKECLELWSLPGKTCHLQGDKYFSVLITLVVNFSFWDLKCLHANCSLMTVFWVVLLCWEGSILTLIVFFSSFGQTWVLLLCTRGVFPH